MTQSVADQSADPDARDAADQDHYAEHEAELRQRHS